MTRRAPRFVVLSSSLVFALALVWPAGIAATPGASSSQATPASAPGGRGPAVRGQGVRPLTTEAPGGEPGDLQAPGREGVGRGPRAGTDAGSDTAGAVAPAPVQATTSGAPAAASVGGWAGIGEATAGFEPPDPWVAAGPDDIVQSVNNRLRFTNREGFSRVPEVPVFNFFDLNSVEACSSTAAIPPDDPSCTPVPTDIDGVGAPRWRYSAARDRWVGMTTGWHCADASAGQSGFIFGAISLTNDPTGDYYHFYVQYPLYLPDDPTLGGSTDKLTFGVNELVLGEGADCTAGIPFDAASTTTFDWAELGGPNFPSQPSFTYDFSFDHFAPRPAWAPSGGSTAVFVVSETSLGETTSDVAFWRITGTNAANNIPIPLGFGDPEADVSMNLTTAGVVGPFIDPPTPQQPGTDLPAGAVDRRPTDAIWQNSVLTFPSTYPCDPAGGASETRACGRVTQLNTGSAVPTRRQDMLIAVNGKDVFYPGVAQSQTGTLHAVYTESSATQGHTSVDRYQLVSDSVHTLSDPVVIASGGAVSYGGQAWGRSVGLAQDPRDTNAVWQGNQYTNASGDWATRVSELQTLGSTFVPLAPVRLLDSRFGNGTSGAFAHGVPKSIDIAGRGGVPNNAVAITGNLTVVGQTAAGYASLTQQPIADPATSTINFPLGDTRANNVTAPLSGAGGVSLTYRASPTKSTHFILDVTGYFIDDDVALSHTFTDIAAVRVLDTRPGISNGLAGVFPANTNRHFDVAGRFTIPANAKAITGNLTVVGQTRAGYVTLATDPPPSLPATSTINFPAGDTRANGVTIKLDSTGGLWAVYKAPPGSSTHLILDVTGYYLQDTAGARFVALTPGRRMDTRFAAPQQGLTGPFAANAARTLVITPYQGVPNNAVAITGNLTVVGQTRAGYVSMTQVATNSPTTSTINFPLGDTRANGVTGPLNDATGSVGLVYEASGGQTHLILDLTGYFR
ncbi:MAG TPA: hypothetical protein VF231_05710 [Candidatus Limnocylindrales bacterium]